MTPVIVRLGAEADIEDAFHHARSSKSEAMAIPQMSADQRKELLSPGFLAGVPFERLKHYPRYIRAIAMRLDKIASNPERDANWLQQLAR